MCLNKICFQTICASAPPSAVAPSVTGLSLAGPSAIAPSAIAPSTQSGCPPHARSSWSGTSALQAPLGTTPLVPPLTMDSTLFPNQPSKLLLALGGIPEDNILAVSPDFPMVAEMLREQQAATGVTIRLALDKVAYLQTQVDVMCTAMIKHIIMMDTHWREVRHLACMDMLGKFGINEDNHQDTKVFVQDFINNRLPAINLDDLFKRVGRGLLSVSDDH